MGPENYLHGCLNDFKGVSRRSFGEGCDLEKIEQRVAGLRTGRVSLLELLEKFRECSEQERWLRAYWLMPPSDGLSASEKSRTFSFHQFSPANEGGKIQELLDLVRQIELVSLILRFIRPDQYGILTPPVASILRLPSAETAVETYLHYLHNIREIRATYGFRTAAEVDMALWVLSQKCADGKFNDPKIRGAFERDDFMLRLRASNMVLPLVLLTPAKLASAFYESNPLLAGLAGCYALEKNVKRWAEIEDAAERARQFAEQEKDNAKKAPPALNHYIRAIRDKPDLKCRGLRSMKLVYLNKLRNKIVHGDSPSSRELKSLVEAVVAMENVLDGR